jgi:GntR family transcriptional regulator
LTEPTDEQLFRMQRGRRVHANNSVRRTYDLIRSALRTLDDNATVSEAELVHAFSASRNTVRLVLQQLAEHGVVSRGPKVGTTVAGSTIIPMKELAPLAGWHTRSALRSRVLETAVIPAFDAIRHSLGLAPGATVGMIDGVVLDGELPLALFVGYVVLHPEQAEHLADEGLSVIAFLERHMNVTIVESDTVLSVLAADEQTAELLQIPPGSPIGLLEDHLRDADGRPWAVCQLRCRGDRMSFSATARRVVRDH